MHSLRLILSASLLVSASSGLSVTTFVVIKPTRWRTVFYLNDELNVTCKIEKDYPLETVYEVHLDTFTTDNIREPYTIISCTRDSGTATEITVKDFLNITMKHNRMSEICDLQSDDNVLSTTFTILNDFHNVTRSYQCRVVADFKVTYKSENRSIVPQQFRPPHSPMVLTLYTDFYKDYHYQCEARCENWGANPQSISYIAGWYTRSFDPTQNPLERININTPIRFERGSVAKFTMDKGVIRQWPHEPHIVCIDELHRWYEKWDQYGRFTYLEVPYLELPQTGVRRYWKNETFGVEWEDVSGLPQWDQWGSSFQCGDDQRSNGSTGNGTGSVPTVTGSSSSGIERSTGVTGKGNGSVTAVIGSSSSGVDTSSGITGNGSGSLTAVTGSSSSGIDTSSSVTGNANGSVTAVTGSNSSGIDTSSSVTGNGNGSVTAVTGSSSGTGGIDRSSRVTGNEDGLGSSTKYIENGGGVNKSSANGTGTSDDSGLIYQQKWIELTISARLFILLGVSGTIILLLVTLSLVVLFLVKHRKQKNLSSESSRQTNSKKAKKKRVKRRSIQAIQPILSRQLRGVPLRSLPPSLPTVMEVSYSSS